MLNYILVFVRVLITSLALMFFTSAACAMSMDDVEQRMGEAKQLRAAEFSPEHYGEAKESLADAKKYIQMGKNDKARKALDKSANELDCQSASNFDPPSASKNDPPNLLNFRFYF